MEIKGKFDFQVVFDRDDFYAHEVWSGCLDLRILLRPGDSLSAMITDLGGRRFSALRSKLTEAEKGGGREVKTASLAFVGERRPRNGNLRPAESPPLKAFLERWGVTVEELEQRTLEEERAAGWGATDAKQGVAKTSGGSRFSSDTSVMGQKNPWAWAVQPAGANPGIYGGGIGSGAAAAPSPAAAAATSGDPAALLAHPGISLAARTIKLQSAEDPKVRGNLICTGKIAVLVLMHPLILLFSFNLGKKPPFLR